MCNEEVEAEEDTPWVIIHFIPIIYVQSSEISHRTAVIWGISLINYNHSTYKI